MQIYTGGKQLRIARNLYWGALTKGAEIKIPKNVEGTGNGEGMPQALVHFLLEITYLAATNF